MGTETIVAARITQEEKQLAMRLAEYFYIKGYLKKPTISDLIRFSLLFMNKFYGDVENIINQKLFNVAEKK